MSPIPDSDQPGFTRLHERASAALDRLQEARDIDFKESASWNALKWTITRTVLAMANLRDGGLIVIGVSERGTAWNPKGMQQAHISTFDPDQMNDVFNSHASPHVETDVVALHRDGKQFLCIYVHEFTDTPVVCQRGGPPASKLEPGGFYVRPHGKPQTTRISDALQMRDLLELAAEKRAQRLLTVSRRIGLVPSPSDHDPYERELGGL